MSVNQTCVSATPCIDSDHPEVIAFAEANSTGASKISQAVSLYYAVRDGFQYSPWGVYLEREAFKASAVLGRARSEGAHCVDKAVLLAACLRSRGIPARLHFADVRNHIGTARLEEMLGTDLLVYHGYCEIYLESKWVAATPAFNRELCQRLNVAPLEFDGRQDSVFQEYDEGAGRFMEYVRDHGSFETLPFESMTAAWREHYPSLRQSGKWPRPPSSL